MSVLQTKKEEPFMMLANAPPARPKLRAVDAEDKEQRRTAILDAAEQQFARSPDRTLNMAEVAAAAGLAKGTVYLYFDSKESLLLSLHERRVEGFFADLVDALEHASEFQFEDLAVIVRRHMTDDPLYMALGSAAMSFMDQQNAPEALQRLSSRISGWMVYAGSLLEGRFEQLVPGEGVRMLVHGYALIFGLWHLLGAPSAVPTPAEHALGSGNYADETEDALRRYWTSVIGRPAAL